MRTAKDQQVCDTKVLYDTEFEAERAANLHRHEMRHYQCPGTKHYHISHVDKNLRTGVGYRFKICPTCKKTIRRKGSAKHERSCNGI